MIGNCRESRVSALSHPSRPLASRPGLRHPLFLGDGAVPGEYAVTVRSVGDVSVENPSAPLVSKIPQKYADPAKSNLKAAIAAGSGGAVELNFTLED